MKGENCKKKWFGRTSTIEKNKKQKSPLKAQEKDESEVIQRIATVIEEKRKKITMTEKTEKKM